MAKRSSIKIEGFLSAAVIEDGRVISFQQVKNTVLDNGLRLAVRSFTGLGQTRWPSTNTVTPHYVWIGSDNSPTSSSQTNLVALHTFNEGYGTASIPAGGQRLLPIWAGGDMFMPDYAPLLQGYATVPFMWAYEKSLPWPDGVVIGEVGLGAMIWQRNTSPSDSGIWARAILANPLTKTPSVDLSFTYNIVLRNSAA